MSVYVCAVSRNLGDIVFSDWSKTDVQPKIEECRRNPRKKLKWVGDLFVFYLLRSSRVCRIVSIDWEQVLSSVV